MQILETLSQTSANLLMPSESDYPFDAYVWEGMNWDNIERHLKSISPEAVDLLIETTTLDHLFRNVAVVKEWHDDQQKLNVQKFQSLLGVLQHHLQNIRVYRVGTTEVNVYIVGEIAGGLAGIHTTLIET
jgi:Nuclease A inhibitor-like protein